MIRIPKWPRLAWFKHVARTRIHYLFAHVDIDSSREEIQERVLIPGLSNAAIAYTLVSPLSKDISLLSFPYQRSVFWCGFIVIINFDMIPCNFNVMWLNDAILKNVLDYSGDSLLFLTSRTPDIHL
jgi:hypothetical protein